MKKEFKTLSDEIELWKLKFGISASQSSKCEELNNIIKEFISLIEAKILTYWKGQNEFIEWLKERAGDKLI